MIPIYGCSTSTVLLRRGYLLDIMRRRGRGGSACRVGSSCNGWGNSGVLNAGIGNAGYDSAAISDTGFFVAGVMSSGYLIFGSGSSGLGNVGNGLSGFFHNLF